MKEYTVKVYDETDGMGNYTAWFDKQGLWHREDGPAVEYTSGAKFWYIHGKSHREDGPAIIHHNGEKGYWLNGMRYTETDFHKRMEILKSTMEHEVSYEIMKKTFGSIANSYGYTLVNFNIKPWKKP